MYSIRLMTFNIRGCRGTDGRVDPERIVAAIRKEQPDIVALQEVASGSIPDQLAFLSEKLGLESFGSTCQGGNAFLSRFPLSGLQEYDLGNGGVCLRADADIHDKRLHLFNVRLQAFPFPRRRQIVKLMSTDLLGNSDLVCPKMLLGDFADPWFGMGTIELFLAFRPASSFWRPTFPSRFPVFPRDRIYFQGSFKVLDCRVLKNSEVRLASSHLPLILTFQVKDSLEYLKTKKIRNSRMETAPGCFRKRTEA
ncbi:MAG: endonuclease/exonuclease/phosphatase family protein [Deltaproteobacteria bacterium]|nr:endonuclease/exonuclease/phosphatase family protein [Deltaproteobacteria bacterium]